MFLTTKIRPSKPRVQEEYSCTFLVLIRFHELCCDFHGQVHIWGEIGTNMSHKLGTAEPPARAALQMRSSSQVRPALPGVAAPAPWLVPSPIHLLSCRHNLDEWDRPRKRQFDRMDEVRITWINGSTYTAVQPPQPSFQSNPRHPWANAIHHTAQSWAGRTSQPSYQEKPT
jgi:hypothetical protein